MKAKNIIWVKVPGFGIEYQAFAGRIKIGSCYWDSSSAPINKQGEKLEYEIRLDLPQISPKVDHFINQEEAQQAVEKCFVVWLSWVTDKE